MTMWLPDGWWIITEVTNKGVRFTAGANGLPEIESSAKFRSDREATSMARKALRSMSYENQDSGWSKFRCHARLPGQTKAFCGARIEDSPNTKHAYSEQCGNCLRIVESMPDPDEDVLRDLPEVPRAHPRRGYRGGGGGGVESESQPVALRLAHSAAELG